MIEKLTIENFQSHADSSFEFDAGVNVIIGQSDSGKSAVIRALNWVCNNKPSGDDFRSDWGGDTSVSIECDGRRIVREKKGKTGNSYYQQWLTGACEIEEFKAFGNSVPDELRDHINMTDINWQRQLDSPFLLSNTAGEVAQKLNEIVNLSVIDTSLSNIQARKRDQGQKIREKEAIIEEHSEDLKKFDHLPAFKAGLKEAEALDIAACSISDSLDFLEAQTKKIKDAQDRIEKAEVLLKYEERMSEIEEMIIEWTTLQEILEDYIERSDRLSVLADRIEKRDKIIEKENEVERLWFLRDESEALGDQIGLLEVDVVKLNDLGRTIERCDEQIKEMTEEYRHEMDELEVCPLCGKEKDVS